MGNSQYRQFLFSKIAMLTMVDAHITFGAAGAVSSTSGQGLYAVTKLATGVYKVQLKENFNAFIGLDADMQSGLSGVSVAAGAFVAGTLYQITALGNTNFAAVGLDSGLTAAVGQQFVATGVGAGTGTVQAVVSSGVAAIQVAQPAQMLAVSTVGAGAILMVQTFDYAGAAVSPASGSIMDLNIYLRNSGVTY